MRSFDYNCALVTPCTPRAQNITLLNSGENQNVACATKFTNILEISHNKHTTQLNTRSKLYNGGKAATDITITRAVS